uniref:Uncharacterized protein n=1 Tax=Vitis vinifera TaxID=29760 RepID=A5BP19_VITVI|nr:hypothetical protein VITISV_015189 [Vitis vinifera]
MGLRKHFAAKWDFRSRVPFSQPISQLRNGVGRLRNGTRVPKGCFAAVKHHAKWGFGCEIPAQLCAVHLQTAITFSFQLQIKHRLKLWTPDFPSFEKRYIMHNLSSRKCFKNVSNSSKMQHFRSCHFAAISQLRNEGHCAAKWHSCAKRWFRNCENFRRGGHGAAKSFRSEVAISQGAIVGCEISQTTEFSCF